MTTDLADPTAPDLRRRRAQRAWYFYDWANSAYVTTTATVLFGPYLTAVAKTAACPGLTSGGTCSRNLVVLGLPVSPGSLVFYAVTFSTILSAFVLPICGAIADRVHDKRRILGVFAWIGAAAATAMFAITGSNWQLGVALQLVANLSLGASLVVYDAILCEIATPDERDAVSSRGWAIGYLGGGLLLLLNLVMVTAHGTFGMSEGLAVRVSIASAGVWWAAFTLIPYLGLRGRPTLPAPPALSARPGSLVGSAFGQLASTFRHARGYPQTLLFLLAYLFFNDGIQTVISASSVFGAEQLGMSNSQLIVTILIVQFVAFGGALLFGRLAGRYGAWRAVLGSLAAWTLIVALGYFVPAHQFTAFVGLAVLIGIVLGGSQALSRSLFSQLIPSGREAEYFSLYQACERGTSWFGTLLFGIVHQLTGSYRSAIVALVVFFVVGGVLLARVDVRRGITDAGNAVPTVV